MNKRDLWEIVVTVTLFFIITPLMFMIDTALTNHIGWFCLLYNVVYIHVIETLDRTEKEWLGI